jgi:hypothetical protein
VTKNWKTINDFVLSYNKRVRLQAGKKENLMKRAVENLSTRSAFASRCKAINDVEMICGKAF